MEIKEVAIGGIDRHTPSQDVANGVCEELINVRSDAMGLHVYKEGTAVSGELDLEKVFMHRWGGRVWYIGIRPDGRLIRFDPSDGSVEQELDWVSSAGQTDIKSLGNMLIVSDKGADGRNPSMRTYVLKEGEGSQDYVPLDKDLVLPQMERSDVLVKPISQFGQVYRNALVTSQANPQQSVRTPSRRIFSFFHYLGDVSEWGAFQEGLKDTLRGAVNRLTALDKHLAYGYVLLGTSVTLYDGTETAFGNLMVVDLSPKTPYRDAGNLPTVWQYPRSQNHFTQVLPMKDSLDGLFFNWINRDRNAYFGFMPDGGDLGGTNSLSSYVTGLVPRITLDEGIEGLREYVKSVSLWVSKPIDKIDWETFKVVLGRVVGATTDSPSLYEASLEEGKTVWDIVGDNTSFIYPFARIRKLEEMAQELRGQLLFRQKEWTLDDIVKEGGAVTYECEFGTSGGSTGDTLAVDAFSSKRAGTMFIYNNRIHMFDSCVKVDVQDRDLKNLSGWDDEWYVSQENAGSQSGEWWHMKYADSYDSRRDTLRDITLEEAANTNSSRNNRVLGLYHDSSRIASDDADSYDWYQMYKRPKETSKYAFLVYPITPGYADVLYVYLSEDRRTLTHDTSRARYMALSTENSLDTGDMLDWYNVPEESWGEAALREVRECTVVAYLKDGANALVVRHEGVPILFRYDTSGSGVRTLTNVANLSGFLTYPDSRCRRLVIQYTEGGRTYGWEVALSDEKSSYNYAYAAVPSGVEFMPMAPNTDLTDNVYQERDTVVVSSLNNPTVFPVSQSYRFAGAVTGIRLVLEELKSTQSGTYPLYVLTERGTFAMNQGSGGVLYANATPINTDKSVKGKSVQVRNGIAYYANGRLYWLVGRKRENIFLPLEGSVDLAPRRNRSYPLACQWNLYDVTSLLSSGHMDEFMEGSSLGYDSFHDELLVSNPAYGYTYVFNFGARRWFKIGGRFAFTEDSGTVLSVGEEGRLTILDISGERQGGSQTIHIQTRPMKLAPMAFGVIQRVIARIRATLKGGDNLSVYVFSSNDLEHYTCTQAQQRKDCTIDRIRLERTAHAYKYTVIVIGGKVPTDTELSTILFQTKPNANKKIR